MRSRLAPPNHQLRRRNCTQGRGGGSGRRGGLCSTLLFILAAAAAVCRQSVFQVQARLPDEWGVKNEVSSEVLKSRWARQGTLNQGKKQQHAQSCHFLLVVAPWCNACPSAVSAFDGAERITRDAAAILSPLYGQHQKPLPRFFVIDGDAGGVAEHYGISHYPTLVADCGSFVVSSEGLMGLTQLSADSIAQWMMRLIYPVQKIRALRELHSLALGSLFQTTLVFCNATVSGREGEPSEDAAVEQTLNDAENVDPTEADVGDNPHKNTEQSPDLAGEELFLHYLEPVARFGSGKSAMAHRSGHEDSGSAFAQETSGDEVPKWTLSALVSQARMHAPHQRSFTVASNRRICERLDIAAGDFLLLRARALSATVSNGVLVKQQHSREQNASGSDASEESCLWWRSGDYTTLQNSPTGASSSRYLRSPIFENILSHWVPTPLVFSRRSAAALFDKRAQKEFGLPDPIIYFFEPDLTNLDNTCRRHVLRQGVGARPLSQRMSRFCAELASRFPDNADEVDSFGLHDASPGTAPTALEARIMRLLPNTTASTLRKSFVQSLLRDTRMAFVESARKYKRHDNRGTAGEDLNTVDRRSVSLLEAKTFVVVRCKASADPLLHIVRRSDRVEFIGGTVNVGTPEEITCAANVQSQECTLLASLTDMEAARCPEVFPLIVATHHAPVQDHAQEAGALPSTAFGDNLFRVSSAVDYGVNPLFTDHAERETLFATVRASIGACLNATQLRVSHGISAAAIARPSTKQTSQRPRGKGSRGKSLGESNMFRGLTDIVSGAVQNAGPLHYVFSLDARDCSMTSQLVGRGGQFPASRVSSPRTLACLLARGLGVDTEVQFVRPTLLFVTVPWCGHCQLAATRLQHVLSAAKKQQRLQSGAEGWSFGFDIIRMDGTADITPFPIFTGVTSFPALIFVAPGPPVPQVNSKGTSPLQQQLYDHVSYSQWYKVESDTDLEFPVPGFWTQESLEDFVEQITEASER